MVVSTSPKDTSSQPRQVPQLHMRLINAATQRRAVIVSRGYDEDGKRLQDWWYFHGSEEQVSLERDRLRLQLADGTYIPKRLSAGVPRLEGTANADPTVVEALERWLRTIIDGLSPRVATLYRSQVAHLSAYFSARSVRSLVVDDIVGYRSFCLASGGRYGRPLSPKSTKERLHRLRSALDMAEIAGDLDRHPWKSVPRRRNRDPLMPRVPRRRKRVFSDAQLDAILAEVKGTYLEEIVVIAVDCGPRLGEAYALVFGRVDYSARTISFEGQPEADGDDDSADEEEELDDPKTISGLRSVPMSPRTARLLRAALRRHASICRWKSHDECRVFPGTPLAAANPVSAISLAFKRVVKRLGYRKVSFHTLRHTFATRQIMAGVQVQRLSYWLGHADPAFTLRAYAHFFARVAGRAESNRHFEL